MAAAASASLDITTRCMLCKKEYGIMPGHVGNILACGHALCETCVTTLAVADGPQEKCPGCFTPTEIRVQPGGDAIGPYVEEASHGIPEQACKECLAIKGNARAEHFCDTCDRVVLCQAHAGPHRTNGHRVREMYPFSGFAKTCEKHDTLMFFFCKTCSVPVCANCLLLEHSHAHSPDSPPTPIEAAVKLLDEQLSALIELLSSGHEHFVAGAGAIRDAKTALDGNLESSKVAVTATFQKLREIIAAREREVLEYLDACAAGKHERYDRQLFCEESTSTELSLMIAMAKAAIASKNVVTMVKARECLRVVSKLVPDVMPPIAVSSVLRFDSADIDPLGVKLRTAGDVIERETDSK